MEGFVIRKSALGRCSVGDFFSIFAGGTASQLLEYSVEVANTGKAAGTVDFGDILIPLKQQRTGFFKAEYVQKCFEMHAEPLVKER